MAALILFTFATPAQAWWDYGHRTVAQIAYQHIRPSTRAALDRLLRQSALLETPTCPARTIEDASVWADCAKSLGDRFSYAYAWHFQDVDICRPFDLREPCANGNCVSAQITRDLKLLKNRRIPIRERLQALLFLIHFVGDLHMPLHAGERGDAGGNRFRVVYGTIPSNLHSIWDGLLADRAISTEPAGAALVADLPEAERAAMATGTVRDWSRESWQVAHDSAYGGVMADPCAPPPRPPPVLNQAGVERLTPILRRQVARAGLRLARLLDTALGR